MLKGMGGWGMRLFAAIAAVCSAAVAVPAQVPSKQLAADVDEAAPTSSALSFGTFPSHSLVQLEAFYAQLALYLSESVGRSVRFGTSSSYGRFRERLSRSEFDIAFIQASEYTQFAFPRGYRPLLRARSAPLLFVVRPDSPVHDLRDLHGHTLAMPPIEEDATTVALRRLREVGLQPDRDVAVDYLPQNNACLQHVISGRSVAAAISEDALQFAGARLNIDYRVIDAAAHVPPPLFVAAARLSASERQAITAALRAWASQPANQGSPAATGWMNLVSVRDEDYAVDVGNPATRSAGDRGKEPSRRGSAPGEGS